MDANNTRPSDEWPLPPPWMWGCRECIKLYKWMKQAPEVVDAARATGEPGVDYDPMDTVVTTQIRLAQHIATDHAREVPPADPGCAKCASDAASPHLPLVLAREHRARHLFAPPGIVDLM